MQFGRDFIEAGVIYREPVASVGLLTGQGGELVVLVVSLRIPFSTNPLIISTTTAFASGFIGYCRWGLCSSPGNFIGSVLVRPVSNFVLAHTPGTEAQMAPNPSVSSRQSLVVAVATLIVSR